MYVFAQDHYRQLEASGEWRPDGQEDVLTMALGTPEPRGRVRAAGHGVSKSIYWNTPVPTLSKGWKGPSSGRELDERINNIVQARNQEERQMWHRERDLLMKNQEAMERRLREQNELLQRVLAAQSGSGSNNMMPPQPPQPPAPYYMPDPPVVVPSPPPYYASPPAAPQVPLMSLLQQVSKLFFKVHLRLKKIHIYVYYLTYSFQLCRGNNVSWPLDTCPI